MGSPDPMSVQAAAHVLAVDDDPSVRQMIVDYLGDNEMRVTAIASGREIADVMARETIDLLVRSEEHTSELQSLAYLVCRLLLEKKKKQQLILLVAHYHTSLTCV